MTYTLLPNSGQSLGQTRSPIRTNFQLIQTAQNTNHVAIDASGAGKHKFLQMPEQPGVINQVGVPLPPTTAANEGGLYTKVGSNPAETNLVFRAESDGYEYQMTKSIAASTARFGTSPNGWTFLPGGLILQWGEVAPPGTTGIVTFATANINFPTSIIQVQLQMYDTSNADESAVINQNIPPTTTQFNYATTASGGSAVMKWWALGT